MSKTIVHVGQMKSGTTYVQEILSKNRDRLRKQGIVYPGGWLNQQPAIYGICGSSIPWVKNKKPHLAKAEKLRDEIVYAKSEGYDVLLSAEALSSCNIEGIEEFLDFIGGADKAIFSVRNLHKTLPSAWQQTLKTGSYNSITDFFEQMEETWASKSGRWKTYAYGESAKRWAKFLPVEAYVLPNNNKDRNAPWELFCQAAGIVSRNDFVFPEKEENSSFSMESADVLRKVSHAAHSKGLNNFNVAVWYFDNFITGAKFKGKKISPPIQFSRKVEDWVNKETELLKKYSKIIYGDMGDMTEKIDYLYAKHEPGIKSQEEHFEQYVEHVLNFYSKTICSS